MFQSIYYTYLLALLQIGRSHLNTIFATLKMQKKQKHLQKKMMFPKIGEGRAPKSSILMGIFIINHPFWGTPIFGNTQIKLRTSSSSCNASFFSAQKKEKKHPQQTSNPPTIFQLKKWVCPKIGVSQLPPKWMVKIMVPKPL